MRIAKYAQSCFLIDQSDGGRIAIDIGSIPGQNSYDVDLFGSLDAVLFTHRHGDHLDRSLVDTFVSRGVELYANADVGELLEGIPVTEVSGGEAMSVAGFEILPIDLPHCVMVDGSPGPPNTGFLVNQRFFHPGDGISPPEMRPQALAVPISGPSISFRDAYRMIETLGPELVVPMHYDVYRADPDRFANACAELTRVIVLDNGESVDL